MNRKTVVHGLICALILTVVGVVGCDVLVGPPTPTPPAPGPPNPGPLPEPPEPPAPVPPPSPSEAYAVVEGPEQVLAGDLSQWRVAKESQGEQFSWAIIPKCFFQMSSDGRQVIFARRQPGDYTWILVAVGRNGSLDIETFQFRNSETIDPEPGPGPDPDPDPDPDPPGPVNSLSAWVKQSFEETIPASPTRAETAHKLGESMTSIGSAAAAGTFADLPTLMTETQLRNREAIGWDVADEWEPWATDKLSPKIESLQLGDTPANYGEAWISIGNGLLAVE